MDDAEIKNRPIFSEKRMSMAPKIKAPPKLTALPLLPQENLYVGVDIGKFRHVAGFLSRTLLVRHERFEGCPTCVFDQSREGFRPVKLWDGPEGA